MILQVTSTVLLIPISHYPPKKTVANFEITSSYHVNFFQFSQHETSNSQEKQVM